MLPAMLVALVAISVGVRQVLWLVPAVCGVPGMLWQVPDRTFPQATAKLLALVFLRLYNGIICTGCLMGAWMVTGHVNTCLGFLAMLQQGHAVCLLALVGSLVEKENMIALKLQSYCCSFVFCEGVQGITGSSLYQPVFGFGSWWAPQTFRQAVYPR